MNLALEQELKKTIRDTVGKTSPRVVANPGGGEAILRPPKGRMVLHSESLVEGVHFDLTYSNANELGQKSVVLAMNCLASMGAKPLYASVSLGLRQEHGEIFVSELFSGVIKRAKPLKVDLVADNTFPSPSFLVVNITVIGEIASKRKFTSAEGAKPKDLICVTGIPGASAAGLAMLKKLGRGDTANFPLVLNAHLLLNDRVRVAEALVASGMVSAMVPLRDGITKETFRISEESGVGMLIDQSAIPSSEVIARVAGRISGSISRWALYGGEDYELLFTIRPRALSTIQKIAKRKKVPLHVIGEVCEKKEKVKLINLQGDKVPLLPRVWTHYARRGS